MSMTAVLSQPGIFINMLVCSFLFHFSDIWNYYYSLIRKHLCLWTFIWEKQRYFWRL